ncbi:SRPBCC domain-containing protein [Kordia sp. YSTF-M3]|uniref:SRPBCC domain-containing protein n=1 Tax=Kordia aestuariivivens TaxID=2759037 RepID=A0ABR7QBK3_9FLAO|nr:SRPBCC domain-containing protein [Kordia aestuariivivens]MBC8755898.1 SRPBCC domain-containing protein [Kordia aestuariivivens]
MKASEPPIIVSQVFEASAETVWNAITEVEQMQQWFFDNIPDFKAEVGFQTQFNVKAPSRDFLHIWKVTEVVPQQKIVTNWKYENCKGNSFVTFELKPHKDGTQFTVTTKVTEDFSDDIPEFERESCIGGWTYFIKERLYPYLLKTI